MSMLVYVIDEKPFQYSIPTWNSSVLRNPYIHGYSCLAANLLVVGR